MTDRERTAKGTRRGLSSLARDTRGNTIAIVAASLIPLAGMVGGGVDISRMYIVKTRLQHACDAGALAGRKQMGGGTWAFNNNAARGAAERFFDANIQSSAYGATTISKTFSENAGKVTGVASATLPMTVMRIFGRTTETLNVTCDAEMRLPNTDVMFVLDVTGSMASKAVSSDSQTKIEALRSAVKCFYETVARLDTTENCVGGAPSGGTGNTVQVRFGFVPYASNVNVGRLLKTEWVADNWTYQSREARLNPPVTTTNTSWSNGSPEPTSSEYRNASNDNNSSWETVDEYYGNNSQGESPWCSGKVPATDWNNSGWVLTGWEGGRQNQQTTSSGTNPITRTTTWYTDQNVVRYQYRYRWTANTKRCRIQRDVVQTGTMRRYYSQTDTGTVTTTTTPGSFKDYRYAPISHDISGLKNGTSWNAAVQLPVGFQGASASVGWDGCIEERATVRATSYSPIPSGAKDLDIDLVPSAGDSGSQWGPVLPGAVFLRRYTPTTDWWGRPSYSGSAQYEPRDTSDEYVTAAGPHFSSYFCPTEARKLQSWTTASGFEGYVDGLTPEGNTYHDIGLLWGARFISPTGLFRSENEYTPQGAEIERHLIFMTDGEACTGVTNYTAYGVPWWDRRQTPEGTAPTDGCLTTGTLTEQVNARTAALCTAVKNKNITLWVIWFGASNTTIEDMLENCATAGRFFKARNSTDLQNTFRSIADQISQLRLTR